MYRKRIILILSVLLTSIMQMACGTGGNQIVDDLIEVEMETHGELLDSEVTQVGDYIPLEVVYEEKDFSALDNIEVDEDISILPTTLAYAQTTRMMYDMETYLNNTVKIKGMFYHEINEEYEIDRITIMLLDETSCCQGYFELELPEGLAHPVNGEQIMIVGTYTTRRDGDYLYPVIEVTDYIF